MTLPRPDLGPHPSQREQLERPSRVKRGGINVSPSRTPFCGRPTDRFMALLMSLTHACCVDHPALLADHAQFEYSTTCPYGAHVVSLMLERSLIGLGRFRSESNEQRLPVFGLSIRSEGILKHLPNRVQP